MDIFEGSKDYGTNHILIHYEGVFDEVTLVKWIYYNYHTSRRGRIIEHTKPESVLGWNCGRIVWEG